MNPSVRAPPRVLVVDDEAPIRNFLRRALSRFTVRLRIDEATTKEEALRKVRSESYDIVIADYRLEDGNGVQVLREAARVQPDGQRVILTGYHEADIAIAAINEGRVHRYLEKPLDLEALHHTMSQVLDAIEHPQRGKLPKIDDTAS